MGSPLLPVCFTNLTSAFVRMQHSRCEFSTCWKNYPITVSNDVTD